MQHSVSAPQHAVPQQVVPSPQEPASWSHSGATQLPVHSEVAPLQRTPHPPQLKGSFAVFTQVPLQQVRYAPQPVLQPPSDPPEPPEPPEPPPVPPSGRGTTGPPVQANSQDATTPQLQVRMGVDVTPRGEARRSEADYRSGGEGTMARCYLIQDPYHPYAATFIDVIHRRWGHRAVCVYTDDRLRFREQPGYPILRSREHVAASIELGGANLGSAVRRLQRRFDVAGIVPFSEATAAQAAELAAHLGLGGCPPEVLRRFRDKFGLKEQLRARSPRLRLKAVRRVASVAHVLSGPLPQRYVLKPNDGFGNSAVGMFDVGTSQQELESFFAAHPARAWLLEEFVGGTEYFVNGQVGAPGETAVTAVFECERGPANRHPLTWKVSRALPEFSMLERYAMEVVAASGLIRSPFHLEAKLDEGGPCLIEIGAYLAGNGIAYVCDGLHGGALDVFALAAHHHLCADPFGPVPLDWEHYDAHELVYVHGAASDEAVVETLEGVAQVERLPEFVQWVKRPAVGMQVVPTVGLSTSPWCALLRGPTRERLRAVSREVRGLVRWNGGSDPVAHVKQVSFERRSAPRSCPRPG
jgi:hypothetical protein